MSEQQHRIHTTNVASVYPHYVAKAERKGRTKAEVDEILRWLTGYDQPTLDAHLERQTDFRTFFAEAPLLNPSRRAITGVVCGIRVEDVAQPLMQEIRYTDKLIDELAKGRPMAKIQRGLRPRAGSATSGGGEERSSQLNARDLEHTRATTNPEVRQLTSGAKS